MHVGSRTGTQIRSHAQKYFIKRKISSKGSRSPEINQSSNDNQMPLNILKLTPTPIIELEKFANSLFPLVPGSNVTSPLSNYIITANKEHGLFIIDELNGARELEILCNKILEMLSLISSTTLDPEQLSSLKCEFSYAIGNLHKIFPSVALNPVLCEKWSTVLHAIIKGMEFHVDSDKQNNVPITTLDRSTK